MKQEQIENLKNKIAHQKEELKINEEMLAIYEKFFFIKQYFPEDCLLNIIMFNPDREKGCAISMISTWVGNKSTILDYKDFIDNNINPFYPTLYKEDRYVFKNNNEGHEKFLKDLIGEDFNKYQMLYLNEVLEEKHIKIKKIKI